MILALKWGQKLIWKGHEGILWGDDSVTYPDMGLTYVGHFKKKNSNLFYYVRVLSKRI